MTGLKFILLSIFTLFGISVLDLFSDLFEDIKENIVEYIIPSTSSLFAFLNTPSNIYTLSTSPYILAIFKMFIAIITGGLVVTVQFFIKKYLEKKFKKK